MILRRVKGEKNQRRVSLFIGLIFISICFNFYCFSAPASEIESLRIELYDNPYISVISYEDCSLAIIYCNKENLDSIPLMYVKARKISIINQQISFNAKFLSKFKYLENLTIRNSAYFDLNHDSVFFSSLKVLDLSYNKRIDLKSLCISAKYFPSLSILYLDNCGLSVLPSTIDNFINLKYLELSNNKLQRLPINIIQLKNLTMIGLSNNLFQTFPDELLHMPKLIIVEIEKNKIIKEERLKIEQLKSDELNIQWGKV